MLAEKVSDELLPRLVRHGRVELTDWSGRTTRYGVSGPLVKVELKDPNVVWKLLVSPSLAVGEAYADGRLVIAEDDLPVFFELVFKNQRTGLHLPRQRNQAWRQRQQIAHHYDVGNAYYDLFLGSTRKYSCAYFEEWGDGLNEAQIRSIHYLLRKLRLERGQTLLDIGCGWGLLAVEAAKEYGVKVLGITLSAEQFRSAYELAEREGVSHLVQFELLNYQDLVEKEEFDRVISVGMFEHVGRGNQATYFEQVNRLLRPGGVSVLHTITQQQSRPISPWLERYIFPGGHLPTVAELERGLAAAGLWSIDREDLWQHYARTLMLWRERHRAERERIIQMFDERFYRTRDFWLAGSEQAFRVGSQGLTQVVFAKGKPGDWPPTREYLYHS